MEQDLSYYVRNNEKLRKVFEAQDGGVMKYWATHPDCDFDVDLFDNYEQQIVRDYLQVHKLDRYIHSLPKDVLRSNSLEWYHSTNGSELSFFVAMEPALNALEADLAEQVYTYIDIYMQDAYVEDHRRKYPKGIPPGEFYNKVINEYGLSGLALECLERVLQEYRGEDVVISFKRAITSVVCTHLSGKISQQDESTDCKELYDLEVAFDLKMFQKTYFHEGGSDKLRQAVKEIIEKSTQNLPREDSCKRCREIAKENMMKFNQFTKWVSNKSYPMEKSENGELLPLITSEEREWLRNIMFVNTPGATGRNKLTTMGKFYCLLIIILQDINKLWAAQLLVHGIDMKDLEKETGVILSTKNGYSYYVDNFGKYKQSDCCVYDWAKARKLLRIIHSGSADVTWEEEKHYFKKAVLHVMSLKRDDDNNYLFNRNSLWMAVYFFAIDIGIMYDEDDPNEPKEKYTPQYASFRRFAHELSLDKNPPTRLPFCISSIDSLNKENYERYRHPYPWSKDGLKNPSKGLTLHEEMSTIYDKLQEEFYNLIYRASF